MEALFNRTQSRGEQCLSKNCDPKPAIDLKGRVIILCSQQRTNLIHFFLDMEPIKLLHLLPREVAASNWTGNLVVQEQLGGEKSALKFLDRDQTFNF